MIPLDGFTETPRSIWDRYLLVIPTRFASSFWVNSARILANFKFMFMFSPLPLPILNGIFSNYTIDNGNSQVYNGKKAERGFNFSSANGTIHLWGDCMALKDNLKRIRKAKGITQRELATETGLSFSMISKLESGEQSNPSLETVKKIAQALGVPVDQLLSVAQIESRLLNEANWGLVAVLKAVYDSVDLEWDQNLDSDGLPDPNGDFSVRLRKGTQVTYLEKQNWETLFNFVCTNLPAFVKMCKLEPDTK